MSVENHHVFSVLIKTAILFILWPRVPKGKEAAALNFAPKTPASFLQDTSKCYSPVTRAMFSLAHPPQLIRGDNHRTGQGHFQARGKK